MSLGGWAYLPFLLLWALPVIALQWLAGWRYLWRERRRWPLVVLALGVYFTLADAVAIAAGIWSFDRSQLSGLYLANVPIEETLFYLLTAAMVVQGFTLAWAAWDDRARIAARWRNRLAHLTQHGAHSHESSRGQASASHQLPAPEKVSAPDA